MRISSWTTPQRLRMLIAHITLFFGLVFLMVAAYFGYRLLGLPSAGNEVDLARFAVTAIVGMINLAIHLWITTRPRRITR